MKKLLTSAALLFLTCSCNYREKSGPSLEEASARLKIAVQDLGDRQTCSRLITESNKYNATLTVASDSIHRAFLTAKPYKSHKEKEAAIQNEITRAIIDHCARERKVARALTELEKR